MSQRVHEARDVAEAVARETQAIAATVSRVPEPFRRRTPQKWSAAEHVEHLRLSVRPLNLSFGLPTFLLRIFGTGTPPGRACDQIEEEYRARLAQGATASRPFIPARLAKGKDLERTVAAFQRAYAVYAANLVRTEASVLDSVRLPHPILGRLSIREMSFFTLYHLGHHHALIRREAPGLAARNYQVEIASVEARTPAPC